MSAFWDAQRVARQDQLQAAEREGMQLFGHFATTIERADVRIGGAGRSGPVSEHWVDVVQNHVLKHTMRFCPHVKASPVATMVAMWEPDKMVCIRCFAEGEKLTGDADLTCDECGTVDPEGVHQHVIKIGPFTIVGGLCTPCQSRDKGR